MYIALLVLGVSLTCSGRPLAGLSGSVSGPIEVNVGGKHTNTYELDDLTFALDGNTAFPAIPELGTGNIQGRIGGGSIRVKSRKNFKEKEVKYEFDNLRFAVDSDDAGEARGSITGPIAVSTYKDGILQNDKYNFKDLRFNVALN